MARVVSSFWVGAYLRRCQGAGAFAAVLRHGADEAGAIFVKIVRGDGTADLYGPAPQALVDEDRPVDRQFEQVFARAPEADIDARLERERAFDPDIWVIEVEDRDGRSFLDMPVADRPGWEGVFHVR